MQFLAAALPGFRDLRAPLIAGYLWLIFLWLIFKPDVKTRPSDPFLAAGYDLAKSAGPFWIALAVGVAAYLIGSVSQSMSVVLGHKHVTSKLRRPAADPADRYEEAAKATLSKFTNNPELARQMVADRAAAARKSFEDTLRLPAVLILVNQATQVFPDADRLKAEKDLRLTVFPPLFVLGAVLSLNHQYGWGLALIAVSLCLFLQAHSRASEYRFLMLEAARRGMLRGATYTEFEGWASGIPQSLTGNERKKLGMPLK